MTVRKTKYGTWMADVTVGKRLDGSPDRRQPTFKTKRDAEAEDRRLMVLKETNRGRSYGGILLQDFVDEYFWPQKEGLRPSTKRGYKRDLKLRIIPMLGQTAVEDIGRYDIQKMISACLSRKVATNARETLSSILGLAVEMKVIQVNPASYKSYNYPEATKRPDDACGEWLTSWDEIKAVLAWLERHHPGELVHRITLLGLCFGLRKGEILAAHSDNLHLKQSYLYVNETCTEGDGPKWVGDPKTENAFRPVPIVKLARKWVGKWAKEGCYLVTGTDEPGDPDRAWKVMERTFGHETFDDGTPLPRLTAFSTRHSFATACVDAGVDIEKLAKWMGHSDISTTRRYYIKYKLQNLTADAEMIDRLIA